MKDSGIGIPNRSTYQSDVSDNSRYSGSNMGSGNRMSTGSNISNIGGNTNSNIR